MYKNIYFQSWTKVYFDFLFDSYGCILLGSSKFFVKQQLNVYNCKEIWFPVFETQNSLVEHEYGKSLKVLSIDITSKDEQKVLKAKHWKTMACAPSGQDSGTSIKD